MNASRMMLITGVALNKEIRGDIAFLKIIKRPAKSPQRVPLTMIIRKLIRALIIVAPTFEIKSLVLNISTVVLKTSFGEGSRIGALSAFDIMNQTRIIKIEDKTETYL